MFRLDSYVFLTILRFLNVSINNINNIVQNLYKDGAIEEIVYVYFFICYINISELYTTYPKCI